MIINNYSNVKYNYFKKILNSNMTIIGTCLSFFNLIFRQILIFL